ncbi:MAG: cytochrome c oxidase accessory protein CcoG [Rhodospirillaceae bacterium]|jgi:cytochrome c oxidase accessory protein FixG|nr:cytochrome c oxidase accessory protein CcoG [Rhodospirillaceae bacterium]
MPDDITPGNIEQFDVEPVNKKENRDLFKARTKIHPKRGQGLFRTLKWWIMVVTLGIYYLTPWIRWDRGESLPDQAVLIDIPARRFYFFFIEIWPQELFFVTGLLVLAGVGLFLTTSVAGRMWCGYSCPQTVWTDLFLVVERFIEGERNQRLRLDKADMSASKLFKKIIKHAIWLIIAMLTGGAWIFYYADAPTLTANLFTLEAPMVAYITVAILTFTTYSLGGLMREQICTYMCPWPRIMGAMMDEESLLVTYREDRGEPRRSHKKGESWDDRGDCVDCNVCVAVCPMGIDIRDGHQLECITCALCIDACNSVMGKVDRPRGLIAYTSFADEQRVANGEKSRIRPARPRTLIYLAVFCLVAGIMFYGLFTRSDMDVNVLRDRNPLFTLLSDGAIRNGFTFKVLNKAHEPRTFELSVTGISGIGLSVVGAEENLSGGPPYITVRPDKLKSLRILVTAPKGTLKNDSVDIDFAIKEINTGEQAFYDSVFRGPKK